MDLWASLGNPFFPYEITLSNTPECFLTFLIRVFVLKIHILQRNLLTKKTATLSLEIICWLPFQVPTSNNWKQLNLRLPLNMVISVTKQLLSLRMSNSCNIIANSKLLGKYLNFMPTQYRFHQDRVGHDISVVPETQTLFTTLHFHDGSIKSQTHWAEKNLSLFSF